MGLIPGSGRSSGDRNVNPIQYSCLENPMDKGVWQATVHGVAHDWSDLARMHTRSKCGCFREELEWSESGKYECSPWEAYRGSRILRGERERHCFHWDFPLGKTLFTWGIWGLKETMRTQYSAQKCQGFFFFFFLLPNPENCAGAGLSHFGREFSSVRLHFLRNKW